MSPRLLRPLIALGIAAACAAPQTTAPAPQSTSPSSTIASQTAGGTLPVGAIRFTIVPSRPQATIHVREQVAGIGKVASSGRCPEPIAFPRAR